MTIAANIGDVKVLDVVFFTMKPKLLREAASKLPDESDDVELAGEFHVMDGDEGGGYSVPVEIVKA
jgi:hypothetical protein